MKQSILILAMFLVFFVVHSTHADLYHIDFEMLSDGSTTPTSGGSAASEYASLGVTFAGGRTTSEPKFRDYDSLSDPVTHPTNNDWFIMTTFKKVEEGSYFDIDILFSNQVFDVSGDVIINPDYNVTVTAWDAGGSILGTSEIEGGTTWIAGSFNFISSTSIARIHLQPDVDYAGVGLDNLSVVPVPSAVILGGMGLAFSSWKLRRRKEL